MDEGEEGVGWGTDGRRGDGWYERKEEELKKDTAENLIIEKSRKIEKKQWRVEKIEGRGIIWKRR